MANEKYSYYNIIRIFYTERYNCFTIKNYICNWYITYYIEATESVRILR